jgi:small subunit ribosomal protein S18
MKKQCYFTQNGVKYIDYKDTELLKKFLGQSGNVSPRKKTGICSKYQRQLALAVKRARFMGLLPYIAR